MATEETIRIWPSIAPGSETWSHEEVEFTAPFADEPSKQWSGIRNVVTPTLTVYRPTGGPVNDAAVIVCPGGGYLLLAYDYEGTDIATWFATRGITVFLLKYRLQPTPSEPEAFANYSAKLRETIFADPDGWARTLEEGRTRAVDDGVQALKVIRQRANEFGINPDKVGMIGFSAGAGVVVGAALAEPSDRPNFGCSIYGGDRSDTSASSNSPPLFILVSQDDPFGLAPENINLYQRWVAAGASADLHVFSEGGHGFGMRKLGYTTDHWPDLLEAWLVKQDVLKRGS